MIIRIQHLLNQIRFYPHPKVLLGCEYLVQVPQKAVVAVKLMGCTQSKPNSTPTKTDPNKSRDNVTIKVKHNLVSSVSKEGLPRTRRLGFGSEVVREVLNQLAFTDRQQGVVVGDSEDEFLEEGEMDKSNDNDDNSGSHKCCEKMEKQLSGIKCEALEEIIAAFRQNFIFRNMSVEVLKQVVNSMKEVSYGEGVRIIQQGTLPSDPDCMYYLWKGEVEVVVSGTTKVQTWNDDEALQRGNQLVVPKGQGWIFGDVALLFNSFRTASVFAKTDVVLWTLNRRQFLKFVMRHSQEARALRFVRKVPLLKGLPDSQLLVIAENMKEEVYKNGQYLIKYGERGNELYLIRYGSVRVLRPTSKGRRVEVATLKRGQFVGERTIITGKLRSADCVAQGQVRVIVMNKSLYLKLNNPLLDWIMDYDAASVLLKAIPQLKDLKQEDVDILLDNFEERMELKKDDIVLHKGQLVQHLYVVKMGDVVVDEQDDPNSKEFFKEFGGFTYFGDACIDSLEPSPFTIRASMDNTQLLRLERRQLDIYIGFPSTQLSDNNQKLGERVLRQLKSTKHLSKTDLLVLARSFVSTRYDQQEVIAVADNPQAMCIIKAGECALLDGSFGMKTGQRTSMNLDGLVKVGAGTIYAEQALTNSCPVEASLIATTANTEVLQLDRDVVEQVLGRPIMANKISQSVSHIKRANNGGIKFEDLEILDTVGSGQFGIVRLVKDKMTKKLYALKEIYKAEIKEGKQVEHVLNERTILGDLDHSFCVRLEAAFHNSRSLFLLLEWVAGGELFYHLTARGRFDEVTARFYAANVLSAFNYMHSFGIVYRDLKPENLLLDISGYLKLTDFGFAKNIGSEKAHTICGTPDYQAPEIILRKGTTFSADFWALGILIFELLTGDPPFKSLASDPWETFRRALSGRFYIPDYVSTDAADIIYKLVQVNPEDRLNGKQVREHAWFSGINWTALEQRKEPAPIIPVLEHESSTKNFDAQYSEKSFSAPPNTNAKFTQWDLWDWVED